MAHQPSVERPPQAVLFTSSYCMGGIEAHVSDLASGLIRRGWKVAVICSTLEDIEPLRANLMSMGAEVHAIREARTPRQMAQRAWRLALRLATASCAT